MITRDEIRQLAQVESKEDCAISFYFQPHAPQNKSHREDTILVKDLVRDTLRKAEHNGNHAALREDLAKILQIAEGLHGNHSRGKAIFACREQNIWRELDIPSRLEYSQITVNSRFHLRPLVHAYAGLPSACIALVNRKKARIFELQENEISQKPELEFGESPHVPRSDGFQGYEAGHRERHVENLVMQHFKMFAESLLLLSHREKFETLLIGCQDDSWPEIEPHLQNGLKQKLRGHFPIDVSSATAEEVKQHAVRILTESMLTNQMELVSEVMGEARRNAYGALGLRHVLNALERHEVQTLLLARELKAEAVECPHCRHLDTRMVKSCAVCAHPTRHLADISDALVDLALRNGAEIRFVEGDPHLEKAGHVAALLRFRADQNTAERLAG
jgi:peptide subunit release factor 1 (eRF1)